MYVISVKSDEWLKQHTHTHGQCYLVTPRIQMVARKHAATTTQPYPPSGGLLVGGSLQPPSSVSSLPAPPAMAPASPRSDYSCRGGHGALEAGQEDERSHIFVGDGLKPIKG